MYQIFSSYSKKYPLRFGTFLALIGVLFLTPDTLIMRLSMLERWPLVGWRGVLGGIGLLIFWYFFSRNIKTDLKSLITVPGIAVIILFGINSITFTLGIQETSVMVVLTALATMPVFAAVMSNIFMKEKQGIFGWITIICVIFGVFVVVSDGSNATGQPNGSVVLGSIFGGLTAFGLAFTFTMSRKYPQLAILPAASLGSLWSGVFGFCLSDFAASFSMPIWTVLLMGFIILPISFACLSIAPRYTSAAIVSLIMLLEMVIGPIWVWLGVGETPTLKMVIGASFVLIILSFHIHRTQFN